MKPKVKKAVIASVLVVVFVAVVIGATFLGLFLYNPHLDGGVRVLAYITSSSVAEVENLEEFDFSNVTHLIYAFAKVREDNFEIYVEDEEALARLSSHVAEHYPNVKFMLSVASAWENDGFCRVSHTQDGRSYFAEQCAELMSAYDLDGIDIDWEYPNYEMGGRRVCEDCVSDHASLLETLRYTLPKGALLSYAGACGTLARGYENDRLRKVVDFVNVMLYDYSQEHNSPIADSAYSAWRYQVLGYSKEQINWGLPFYGRCADEGYDYFSYAQIEDLISRGEATLHEDKDESYAMYQGHRLSYDSKSIILKKAQIVKKRGYGGVFCWNFSCDNGELMPLIWDTVRG